MFEVLQIDTFRAQTGISPKHMPAIFDGITCIHSLRSLETIDSITLMPMWYLEKLIHNIPLAGDPNALPYKGAEVRLECVDPHGRIKVAQTFVQRGKYVKIVEEFPRVFAGHGTPRGAAKLNPMIVRGTFKGSSVVAHYIPPIMEARPEGDTLLDGTHRFALGRTVGTTVETVVIQPVTMEFPSRPLPWDEVRFVEAKPPREERYTDLEPMYFRDLSRVGIDG